MNMRMRLGLGLLFAVLTVAFFAFAAPAAKSEAIVLHPSDIPDCMFEPGDVPGVDVFFPATCTVVFTPTGATVIVATGQLPAGYSLSTAFVGTTSCNGVPNGARIVATPSGQVVATCHI
jgi:hypothetical protein